MLSIDKISKAYIQRGKVLDELSLEVRIGDSIAVTGPSGSGKSTLLNMIGLLDKPDNGRIFFENNDISLLNDDAAADYRNRNIGFVFQNHMLLPHLTVYENIWLPLLSSPGSKDELNKSEEYIKSVMDRTGISDIKNKHPFQISGGEAQRVALVRALANQPRILLADEPTGSLDIKNAGILGDLLSDINKDYGVTVILVTHSELLAERMNKKFRLEAGKLIRA